MRSSPRTEKPKKPSFSILAFRSTVNALSVRLPPTARGICGLPHKEATAVMTARSILSSALYRCSGGVMKQITADDGYISSVEPVGDGTALILQKRCPEAGFRGRRSVCDTYGRTTTTASAEYCARGAISLSSHTQTIKTVLRCFSPLTCKKRLLRRQSAVSAREQVPVVGNGPGI